MPPTQEASAGIFSGVIDFVSREFESFVKSATGRKIESVRAVVLILSRVTTYCSLLIAG